MQPLVPLSRLSPAGQEAHTASFHSSLVYILVSKNAELVDDLRRRKIIRSREVEYWFLVVYYTQGNTQRTTVYSRVRFSPSLRSYKLVPFLSQDVLCAGI